MRKNKHIIFADFILRSWPAKVLLLVLASFMGMVGMGVGTAPAEAAPPRLSPGGSPPGPVSAMPSYQKAAEALLKLWKERYPVALTSSHISSNPKRRGILCTKQKRKHICYYHFHLALQRPYRKNTSENTNKNTKGEMRFQKGRKIEAWLQCAASAFRSIQEKKYLVKKRQTKKGCEWNLYFLRWDLLPGKPNMWRKI